MCILAGGVKKRVGKDKTCIIFRDRFSSRERTIQNQDRGFPGIALLKVDKDAETEG